MFAKTSQFAWDLSNRIDGSNDDSPEINLNIQIENVTKRYGTKTAVDNLSLNIPEGEVYAFLGPNGAGKTTTIKMLTGLLTSDQGTIKICGENIRAKGFDIRHKICYIPDEPYLYDRLSGREFLEFVGKLHKLSPSIIAERIEKLGGEFGTSNYIDEPAGSYSHGMKQRVVVMAGLLHDPRVIILDEPMVGLDPRLIRKFKTILRERTRDGATVFMSTHNLADAEEMADRVGIIHRGSLIAEGSPVDIANSNGRNGLEEVFLKLTDEEPV